MVDWGEMISLEIVSNFFSNSPRTPISPISSIFIFFFPSNAEMGCENWHFDGYLCQILFCEEHLGFRSTLSHKNRNWKINFSKTFQFIYYIQSPIWVAEKTFNRYDGSHHDEKDIGRSLMEAYPKYGETHESPTEDEGNIIKVTF